MTRFMIFIDDADDEGVDVRVVADCKRHDPPTMAELVIDDFEQWIEDCTGDGARATAEEETHDTH